MPHCLRSKQLPILMFMFLAGCGGGGSDSATNNNTTSGTSGALSAAGGTTVQLASATQIEDGTAIGTTTWADGSTASGGNGQTVGGLACTLPGATYTYAHLSILRDGKQITLPARIGVQAPTMARQTGCVYPLHTDDASGKIRIDASAAAPTLGQFFAIWGEPLSSSSIASLNGPVTAYINDNGTLTKYSGDLSAIPLPPGREITLVVGSVPAQIPTYAWLNPPPLDTNSADLVHLGETAVGSVMQWPDGDTVTGGQGSPIQGAATTLTCGVMSEDYHVHTHLAIFKDGKMLIVPRHIGIPQSVDGNGNPVDVCNYNIHTHDQSGVLHVETPTVTRFTLGDVFAEWGEPLSRTNVAGLNGNSIRFFINDNGDVREYTGDPATIELISHRAITIQIGTPLGTLPVYAWDAEPAQ